MFWNKQKKQLEAKIRDLEIKQNCLSGYHVWVVRNSYQGYYIGCVHCYKSLEKERYEITQSKTDVAGTLHIPTTNHQSIVP